jgi:hypothetical protein
MSCIAMNRLEDKSLTVVIHSSDNSPLHCFLRHFFEGLNRLICIWIDCLNGHIDCSLIKVD